MDLDELKDRQIEQMKKKGCLPKDDIDVIFYLVKEIEEVCESIIGKQSKESFENEIADVFW